MKFDKKSLVLYAVTDSRFHPEMTLTEQVEEALKGGVTFIQLREKLLDHDAFLNQALAVKKLCAEYGVPFVINDNVDIARECNADGVHLGQDDMSPLEARRILGENSIIGVSAHNSTEALKAQREGADYLGSGAVFGTVTKKDVSVMERETLKSICESVDIPVIAIGGVNHENVGRLKETGICGVAVISALFGHDDIRGAASEMKRRISAIL